MDTFIHRTFLGKIMVPQATLYILKLAQTFTQLMQLVRSSMNMEAMLNQCDSIVIYCKYFVIFKSSLSLKFG